MRSLTVLTKTAMATFVAIIYFSPSAIAQPEPIRIGFIGDFSEVSRSYTDNAFKAAQLAIADCNAKGGLLGRPVEMIRRDGGNDPERHYRHVRDLAHDKKIAAVFGGASSPCLLKASAACKQLHIPYLISIGNSQSVVVENGHPYVFLFEPNSWMESKGFSIFATLMPWKRYAWLGPDYVWGHDVLRFFKQHFGEIGVPIDWATEAWHPMGTKDFSALIRQIIEAKPDALVVASWGEDVRHFIKQAKPTGLFDQMAAFGWFSLIAGESDRLLPEAIWTLSRGPFNYLAAKHRLAGDFVRKFSDHFDSLPLGFTICCYDSMIAWQQAVRNGGSAEPEAVARALKGMSFVGLRGDSYIRAIDGQMNCPTLFGRLVYNPAYSIAVIESVIEIPASNTWLSEEEVRSRR